MIKLLKIEFKKILTYKIFWILTGLYFLFLTLGLLMAEFMINNMVDNMNKRLPIPMPHVARLPSSLLVFELPFPKIPDTALLIDQVDGGPDALLPPIPVLMLRIEEHRISDAQLLHLFGHIGWVAFGLGFGRVDANDHDALVSEAFPPAVIGREIALAVDAAERPEVNDGHLAFP